MKKTVFVTGIILGLFLIASVSATSFGPWTTETVDSLGNVGEYTSLALNVSDCPRISYYDQTNHDLKYAAWDGITWTIETVDGKTKALNSHAKKEKNSTVGMSGSILPWLLM